MRKNTKGFTLVELLAVIVILAIIALIAVPIVMNVIGNARKSAAIESFRGYMDAVEKTIIRDSLKTTSELPSKDTNGCYNLKELDTKVKVKGDKPVIDDEDTLCMEKGKVKSVSEVTISGYKLEYKDGKILVNGKSTETTKPAAPTYTVTYNANGGSGSMEATTNEIVANTFTRTNYEFKEWNTKQDGTGETYTTTSTVSSNLTLYAIWIQKYAYATYGDGPSGDGIITQASQGRTTIPTDKKAYLKYSLTNGEIASGTVPETCIHSNATSGEFCVNASTNLDPTILSAFGYDSSTWSTTNIGGGAIKYENPDKTIACLNQATAWCEDDNIGIYKYQAQQYPDINTVDRSAGITCHVQKNNTFGCEQSSWVP